MQVRLNDFELHRPRQWGHAGWRSISGAVATRRLLAEASVAEPEGRLLAERPENADLLPADRSRQRMAPAPRLHIERGTLQVDSRALHKQIEIPRDPLKTRILHPRKFGLEWKL